MPAPKGSYNARGYHEGKADLVEAALRKALAPLGTGTVFRNVSSLAAHVAPACGRTAGQLRRNPRYRALLEAHVARQPGAVGQVGDDTRSAAILRAKLAEARLRIANLEADKRRLEAFVTRHIQDPAVARPAAAKGASAAPSYRRAFECTAAALEAVIQDAELYKVDPRSGALINESARPGSPPVVGSHLLEDYSNWRKSKRSGGR